MKRVLFISYYFPPSGGSGVQRPLKFVKYFREFNWDPTVLTVDPKFASFPDLDHALEADIPANVRVIRTRSRDPYAAYAKWTGRKKSDAVGVGFLGAEHTSFKEKMARWVRANAFLPDARRGWIRFARQAGDQEIQDSAPFDAIVSTGPPHSAHLVASFLSKKHGIPWVADIRDSWPDIAYAESLPTMRLARKIDLAIRDKALQLAAGRIVVSEDLGTSMEASSGLKYDLIRNGFDPEDFEDVRLIQDGTFTLVHTGNLSPARNPLPLWPVLAAGRAAGKWQLLKIVLVGNVDGTVWESARKHGVDGMIEHIPYVPHEEALTHTCSASVLVLPINRVSNSAGIVTGKIYEYLAAGRPVLGLGDPEGEASQILRESGGGRMFDYSNEAGIADWIDSLYEAWVLGSPLLGASPERAAAYSRRSQTGQLVRMLDSLTEG